MNISEQAKTYAEGKVQEALTAVVEKAYSDGYQAGYNDAIEKLNNGVQELEGDGITYVDLGLPSGTLWASDYLRDKNGKIVSLPYIEAAPLNIPTQEQFEELKKYCDVSLRNPSLENMNEKVYVFARNAKKISLTFDNEFWLRNESCQNRNRKCVDRLDFAIFDMASALSVVLVKNKEK